ncbi:DNA processing protein smf [Mesomycoplasma conjunctivae]|nr:DNA-processing protein DprA [Mesomycoplasma conjunctivae]VEU65964.1 DNA processing protein smf [Mesomycoplasma conjunctivae]
MKTVLIYFSIKYQGDFRKIMKALETNEVIEKDELNNLKLLLENNKIKAITILDREYPKELEYLKQPPFVIFYKGNIDILTSDSPKITLTGDEYDENVKDFFNNSLPEVVKRHTLVVNGYHGVEERVIKYFKLNNAPIILVSANGIENPWLLDNQDNYENLLVISEYPPQDKISTKRLIERNRIVAGLASCLIVYSINKKSGLHNLINYFLNLGKEIYCFSKGENAHEHFGNQTLIEQGANWITAIKDTKFKQGDLANE